MKYDIVFVSVDLESEYDYIISQKPFQKTDNPFKTPDIYAGIALENVHVFTEDELKERDKQLIAQHEVSKERVVENTKANDDITYGLHK